MGLTDYPRVLSLAPQVSDAIDAHGGDIPPWLDLGWMAVESGGKVGESDTSVASLGGELGLFQLAADERAATGYTDVSRMTSPDEADYQIAAGHALIDYYGGKVAAAGVDSSHDPLYWMLIKLAHGIGSGGMHSLVANYVANAPDSSTWSWDDFAAFSRANPFKGFDHTDKWLSNAERVRSTGVALAVAANLVPSGAGAAGGYIPLALLALGAAYGLGAFK